MLGCVCEVEVDCCVWLFCGVDVVEDRCEYCVVVWLCVCV